MGITGATSDMVPEVIFGMADAISGNFAPVAESTNAGVKIYAKETPTEAITIATIILWR